MALRHVCATVLMLQVFAIGASAAQPSGQTGNAGNWPIAQNYRLPSEAGPSPAHSALTPIMMLLSGAEDDVTVFGQRHAPVSTAGPTNRPMLRSVLGLSDPISATPADCTEAYTTVAGQPSSMADLSENVGARGCSF